MNKAELIEMFNSEFNLFQFYIPYGDEDYLNVNDEVADYIFETIIPEVIKSVIPEQTDLDIYGIDIIKEKAKELYGIKL